MHATPLPVPFSPSLYNSSLTLETHADAPLMPPSF